MFGARRTLYEPFLMDGLTESLKAVAPYAGAVSSVAGGLMQYSGARDAGRAASVAAEYEAAQLTQNAGQAQAASQRKAAEERRKSRLVQSAALARAAMSGGASDPTVVDIIGDIAQEGAYRSALALFEGDDAARAMRNKAAGVRYTGDATQRAYKTQANTALFGGFARAGTSLFQKYASSPVGGMEPYFDSWRLDKPYG